MIRDIKNFFHLLQAIVANLLYGFPAKKLFVIGITGTDGKTTTVHLIYHILKSSGKKVAMISSIGAYINDESFDTGFHVTTPSPFALQKYIRKALNKGVEYLVLEVTSHSLDQYRVWGIPFQIGVLTNVSHEHLDYHKSFDHYLSTKIKLLERVKVAVVNRDDESFHLISKIKNQISKLQNKNQKWISFGLGNDADVSPKKFMFDSKLLGEFNRYNVLAAIAVCREIGISDGDIRAAIGSFEPLVGRQEDVYDAEFKVIVDFAHTPNAFTQLLPDIRKKTQGKLIHIFGAAGERDKTKRPMMGKISSRFADVIILTSEDPRSESAEQIMLEIENGISSFFDRLDSGLADPTRVKGRSVLRILDRKKAIEYAIELAQEGDIVLCTGKGHEKSMNYGQGEVSWDEIEIVKEAIYNKQRIG